MNPTLHLLVIEDQPADFQLLEQQLQTYRPPVRCHCVARLEELQSALQRTDWDCVLSDYHVPSLAFKTILATVQAQLPAVPIILVSGHLGEEKAVEVLKQGVWDYVAKENLGRLVPALERALRDATERRTRLATEESLRASEKRFRSLFENMLNGCAYCQLIREQNQPHDFVYLAVNRAFETQTGLKNVTGKRAGEVVPGIHETTPELLTLCSRVAQTGTPEQAELYIASLKMWLALSVYCPDRDQFIILFEVITERKLAEEKLRESEIKFSQIFDASPAATSLSTLSEGRYVAVNDAFLNLFQYSREEVVGHTVLELNIWVNLSQRAELFDQLARHGAVHNMEMALRTKSGQTIHLLWSGAQIVVDGETLLLGSALDITKRKQMEADLHLHKDILEETGRIAKVGGWSFDALTSDGYWTDEVARIHDLDPAQPISKETGFTYYTPTSRPLIEAAVKAAVEQGMPYDLELEIITAKNHHKWIRTIGHPLIKDGRVVRVTGSFQDITERKQAAAALWESESRLNFALTTSHIGAWEMDLTHHTATQTLIHAQIFGYETLVTDWNYERFLAHILPEDRARVDRLIRTAVAAQADWNFECRIRRQDGGLRWIFVAGGHQQTTADQPVRVSGIVQDITERKQSEEALRQSQERYVMIERAVNDGFWDWNIVTDDEYFSPRWKGILGYLDDELPGHKSTFLGLLHPDDSAGARAAMRAHLKAHQPYRAEFRLRHKDGSYRWVFSRGEAMRDTAGRPYRMFGATTDITERKQAEQALRESELAFRTLAESMPQIVWICQPDGQNTYFNQQWVDYTGLTLAESYGTSWIKPFHPEDQPQTLAAWQKATQQGTPYAVECRLRRTDGTYRWWLIRGVPWRQANGEILKWFGTCTDVDDIKQAAAALRENQAKLEAALASMTDAVFIADATGQFIEFNAAFATFHRFKNKAECARHFAEYPNILEVFETGGLAVPVENWAVPRALRGETVTNAEYALRRKDTGETWVGSYSFSPIRDKDGTIAGAVVVARDVTELRQTEEALRIAQFSLEHLGDAALWFKPDLTIVRVNQAAQRLTGYTREELLAHTIRDLHPEPTATLWAERWQELRQKKTLIFETTCRTKDGRSVPVEIAASHLEFEGKELNCIFIRDITGRRLVEESHARLATVVEQAAETIVITDTHGIIRYVNPAFEKTTGYTYAEAIGKNPRLLKSGKHDDEFYRQMWLTLLRGESWVGHIINRRKNGTFFEEEATLSPVRDASGQIVNYVAVKRDVTHEVQLESQLRQSQKMEAIGQLAGGVAHDFNNILSSMLMQAELVAMVEALPEEVREGVDQIRADANRAADLTRQLLLFSRRQVMQPRHLDLNEVVVNLTKMLQRIIGEDVRLQLDLHPTPLQIRADAGMLEQVLMNLAVNARDAMPQGGQLRLKTTTTIVDAQHVQRSPDARTGPHVCVHVADTGGGIPPEILPRIFEPFFTTKEAGKGTGLGLATVFGIVKQHQGWIELDNRPGKGVTFQIYLPAATLTPAEANARATKAKPRGGTETILLVEDEASVRKSLRTILERHGYSVLEAANGPEALQCWPASGAPHITLLLTDLVMPGGMSGHELARQLQAKQPQLKVIYASGYSADIAGRELRLQQGENFIQKPFVPELLLDVIRRALDA